MADTLPYAEIVEQLALIESHLRAHPVSGDADAIGRSLDALACARALVEEVAELANGRADVGES